MINISLSLGLFVSLAPSALIGLGVVSACSGASPRRDYVDALNSVSLLADDATRALFPERVPRSNRAFASKSVLDAARAMRDLAVLATTEPPQSFANCHANVRAHAHGLGSSANELLTATQLVGTSSERVGATLQAWERVRSRTKSRLCGLSAALSACARKAKRFPGEGLVPFIPGRLRCP